MAVRLRRDDETGPDVLGPAWRSDQGGQALGPYRLIQPLGEGGMGVVHLALDPSGRAVAIKVLREHIAHDRDARNRLRREVETLAMVQHVRVASVLDADTEGPRPYIVTRYIPGPTLDRVVAGNGPMTGEALLRLGRGLWEALNAIHRAGVIHRDLKPANVILLDGDPVVIDFGIANVADDIRLTVTGLVMGTPGYLSPEVVEGAPVTEATDWWGWAATLAFAASGAPPFGRGPMEAVLDRVRNGQADLSRVDPRLVPLLRAALSPIPSERPAADEILQALDGYSATVPPTVAIPVAGATGASFTLASAPVNEPVRQAPAESVRPRYPVEESSGAAPMLALSVAVLGVATLWPMVAIGLVVTWSLLARFADRSIRAMVMRRHDRGRRRSDVLVAVVASPWHAIASALAMALALVTPAIVAVGSAYSMALASAAVTGGDPAPEAPGPLLVGSSLGLLMCWFGPGGASLQRGSRSLLRAVAPGKRATDLIVAMAALVGVGLGAWAWVRHGQPDWWTWSLENLQGISRSFW